MASNLLLSPELVKETMEVVQRCMTVAKEEWPDFEFPIPEVRFDVKNTIGGLAYWQLWLIRLNLVLCVENKEKFMQTTVPHECAHLIQRRVFGDLPRPMRNGKMVKMRPHGREWKEVMRVLGVPAKRTHSYNVTSVASRRVAKARRMLTADDIIITKLARLQKTISKLEPQAKKILGQWLVNEIEKGENADE